MRSVLFCLAVTATATAGGCNTKPEIDNSQDPEAYARDVKQLVFDQVATASSSREPADQMAQIVGELEQTDRPRAKYQATYDQLLTVARELRADCNAKAGRPANLTEKLNKLKQLAQTLPGDVVKSKKND